MKPLKLTREQKIERGKRYTESLTARIRAKGGDVVSLKALKSDHPDWLTKIVWPKGSF